MKKWEGYMHGVNLGGWLSQCDHTKDRYDNFIKEEDIKAISGWGVDHVRIPVDYNLVETGDGIYSDDGFKYIDSAIEWCGKYGLNMILDLHKTYGFSFDDGENEKGFFENEKYQERFYKLWDEFARRYGNIGERVAFELLNEVTDKAFCDIWNEIATLCIKRIRSIAPNVKILIGGYYNNSIEALPDLLPPYDENIIYNFHCYEPLIFTHQGAGWIDVMPRDFRMNFKKTYKEYKDLCRPISEYWARDFFVPTKEEDVIDSTYFEKMFASAIKTAQERDVALYCGEYGVIDLATPEDTLEWYKTINPIFEKYSIGRAAWSYKSMNFGLCEDRLAGIRSELLKVM